MIPLQKQLEIRLGEVIGPIERGLLEKSLTEIKLLNLRFNLLLGVLVLNLIAAVYFGDFPF